MQNVKNETSQIVPHYLSPSSAETNMLYLLKGGSVSNWSRKYTKFLIALILVSTVTFNYAYTTMKSTLKFLSVITIIGSVGTSSSLSVEKPERGKRLFTLEWPFLWTK